MLFLKLDENGNPTGYPIKKENLVYILGEIVNANDLNPEVLIPLGYCFYEQSIPPLLNEYSVAEDDGYIWNGIIAKQKWKIRPMNAQERMHTDVEKMTIQEINQYQDNLFKENLLRNIQNDANFQSKVLNIIETGSSESNVQSQSIPTNPFEGYIGSMP